MKRGTLLVGILAILLTFGCGKNEQTEDKTAPEAAKVEAPEKVVEKTEPSDNKMVENVEQSTDNVADKTAEIASQVQEKATEVVETAAQVVEEKAEEATHVVASAVETGKEAAVSAATTVKEKAAAMMETVAPAATSEGEIVMDNSYGKVTFSHKTHSESFDCKTCHGVGEPGALTLGKDKAHEICKGCHIEKAAGPTKCSECHVK